MRLMVGQEYIDWMRVQWEDKKTTFLRQQMLLAVYSSPMGDSDVFTFAIRQPYSSHQPTKHSSTIAYRRRQSLGQRHRRKIPPRDFHAALAHASLDAPGLQCDPARDLASGSPAQSCLPRGPCPPRNCVRLKVQYSECPIDCDPYLDDALSQTTIPTPPT